MSETKLISPMCQTCRVEMECTYIVPSHHREGHREERHFFKCRKCAHEEMVTVPAEWKRRQ